MICAQQDHFPSPLHPLSLIIAQRMAAGKGFDLFLFVTQRVDRIHFCCLIGRIITEKQTDHQ